MGQCNEAKIVIGLTVREWKEKGLAQFINDPNDEYKGETELTKFLETNTGLTYIMPPQYHGWEDDMVVGIKVLSVYGAVIELSFTDSLEKSTLVMAEFVQRFGFFGKIYFGTHEG